ncbi:NADP-dependent oxidoreductase [Amnibacterium flavum]|uniref:NADP-dependent oxidoreductase n=1 Tax=Amnibacterium flavum TaxID=2173173 RepID=A0A2V1HUL8_9MICO|nr:NADP-dependent oxidoreductase [Amnibacterium flavum]PVZ95392.1 NADP-dependent oxidoreductase [Amnibacterium flavum]
MQTTRWVAPRFGGPEVFTLITEELPPPAPGEVTIEVRAAGMNPADYKYTQKTPASDPATLPLPIGYEVAGVIAALGPAAEIASGGGAIGDEVLAFRVRGGWASRLNVPAADVFAKPSSLPDAEASNLLLAGTTAAEMLHVTGVQAGDTVLLHGASGAVGVSVLQQARLIGARVIGTASEKNFDVVRRFGGEPVTYGDGLAERVRALAPGGITAALDSVGTDEAVDVSLALVEDRRRIVTIAAFPGAQEHGFIAIGGRMPASAAFRDAIRQRLIDLAGSGELLVPIARTFPLADALEAVELLRSEHPGGKLALIP